VEEVLLFCWKHPFESVGVGHEELSMFEHLQDREVLSRRGRQRRFREMRQRREVVNSVGMALNLAGANTGRYPSPAIWSSCPIEELQADPGKGLYFHDDFENFSQHVSDQDTQKYASYIDTGVTIKQLAGVENGVIEIAGNDADNDEGVLSGHGPMVNIQDAKANKKLWFEARVKKASIANNALAMFIGLAFDSNGGVPISKTLALTDDDGSLGAFAFLGFHVDQADGDAMDFVYKAHGQTAVVVIAGVHVPVADTYVKLGFVYDPAADAAKRIAVFVDNVEQTTYVTETNIATATFPDNEHLSLCWVTKVGTGSAEVKAQMDWWRLAQLF
jgi:hypothetical protein